MFCRKRKGIGVLLAFNIFLVFLGISLFLFLTFFTYTIRLSKIQTTVKSRESLLVLSVINRQYSYGENFVVSLSNDTQKTNNEIKNYIINFNQIDLSSSQIKTSIYYYYDFIEPSYIEYLSNGKCYKDPLYCKDYSYIIKFLIPKIYDGSNFVKEGIFMSFG